MIQCRLWELMAEKSRKDRRRITYTDIHTQTRIAKTVLSRLRNDRAGMVGMSVIDRLCDYFDCQPGELFVFVPDQEV